MDTWRCQWAGLGSTDGQFWPACAAANERPLCVSTHTFWLFLKVSEIGGEFTNFPHTRRTLSMNSLTSLLHVFERSFWVPVNSTNSQEFLVTPFSAIGCSDVYTDSIWEFDQDMYHSRFLQTCRLRGFTFTFSERIIVQSLYQHDTCGTKGKQAPPPTLLRLC